MKTLLKPLALLSVAGMLAFNANAQEGNMASKPDKGSAKMEKKNDKIIGDILGANMYQTKLLALTQEKAKDAALKEAATQMLPTYQQMGEELTQWASAHGYTTTGSEMKKYEGKLEKWSNHNQGLELDHDLTEELNDLNKDGLDMLKSAKEDTKDADLKAWIEKATVQMREHKAQLDAMKEKAKAPWKPENRPDPTMGNK